MSNAAVDVPDVLVLAAVERAVCHQRGAEREPEGALGWEVLEHLDVSGRSKRGRHVRARLDALVEAGALRSERRHSASVLMLTSAGARRLERARHVGDLPELPESPQHRKWREARAAAIAEIEGFREQLRAALGKAVELIDADGAVSDAWFETGEGLGRLSWQLASATHRAREWPEPDDAVADVDDRAMPGDEQLDPDRLHHLQHLRSGRRNKRQWPGIDY